MASENILELSNPLIFHSSEDKISSSLLTLENAEFLDLEVDASDALQLNLKPAFKLDKKTKKVEKDDDTENSKNRSKLKKKARSKVDFEEDYDSIGDDELERDSNSSVASLSVERPSVKIGAPSTKSIAVKQKGQNSTVSKKKKKSPGQY